MQSKGADLYRRSLYTFWKRTIAPPTMVTSPYPDRALICGVRFPFLQRRIHGARVRRRQVRQLFAKPYIDMVIPTLTDPSIAPPGKHIMSCFVQYAPYKLGPGLNWDDQKEAFGDNVINTIAEYAPNINDIILHRQGGHAARSGTRVRPQRRQHLPGRVLARAALLSSGRCRVGRSSAPPSRTCTCADRPRIPAVASWAAPAGWRPSKS